MEDVALKQIEPHLEKFERLGQQAHKPAWVFPLRKAGLARFAELGFPTAHDEDWRFTNVAPIAKLPFRPVFQPGLNVPDPHAISQLPLCDFPACRLVFVNGHFAPDLSAPAAVPGVEAGSLAAALKSDSPLVQKYLTRLAPGEDNAFTALNTAFFQDGAFVYVPAGRALETPIHLLFLATAREPGATAHPRNLIIAERNSRATIIESYAATTDTAYFTNAVTELVLEDGAVLEHAKFQDESLHGFHMAGIYSRLGRGANLAAHSIALGAKFSRNTIRTSLAGEGVDCVLNGLYLTHGEQLADHHMVVEHAQPHCTSHEYYNGILDGRSKGVFHGRILVRQPAQKTDAKQTNKNLLLSETATIDTKPQLEIYADDVKCTHGATVGQLNEESVFYLRSRGIGAETARRMLIHAFAGEIIERIRCTPVREQIDRLVWQRLEANPHLAEKQA